MSAGVAFNGRLEIQPIPQGLIPNNDPNVTPTSKLFREMLSG
jgi:hypothetical protein